MSVNSVAKPFNKLKRIRSWDELRTRGLQAVTAFREQKSVPKIPTDTEFVELIDKAQFGSTPIIAESIWQRFYKHGEKSFFPSVAKAEVGGRPFREIFGEKAADQFIASAEAILDGRIDLLGLRGLYVGREIDWHREPVSSKRSPLKYWKDFDELDTGETGNRKIIWELNRHQHLFTLGVAYVLTDDERFANAFAGHLDSWMEQNPPAVGVNWSSSLEISFRTMSWLWGLHLFRESEALTPELFKRALKFLYLHGRHIEQYLSTYYSPNTHLTGEALALYYLGTQLRVFERAERWRGLGEEILFDEITKQVHGDGVYFEQSTWYQRYTADIFAQFAVLRSLDENAKPDLRTEVFEERLETCFEHLMSITMPDGRTPLIGDDDGGRMLPLTCEDPDDFRGTLAAGALLFGREDMRYVAGNVSQEVFWLLGQPAVAAYETMPNEEPVTLSRGFVDGGSFVMRDGWSDTDNALIVDCGELGSLAAGHGHADALAINVAIHGKRVLVDPGTYTYHESRELRDFFRSTEAHNTLTVDGLSSSEPGSTFGWKTRAEATLEKWIAEERFDFFAGAHNGYERLADAVTHCRSILFLKNDYWIIRDVAVAKDEHEYALNFHYADDVSPAIHDGGRSIGDGRHRITTFADNGQWEQKESWVSRVHANKTNAPLMRFVSKGTGTQEFFTFIIPHNGGELVVREIELNGGRAFAVEHDTKYVDVIVFNDEPGKLISTGLFDTNFEYSWARMRTGEMAPDELVLVNGNKLVVNEVDVLDETCGGHASIRRLGRELYIKTAETRMKVSSERLK